MGTGEESTPVSIADIAPTILVPELRSERLFDLEAGSLETTDLSEARPGLARSLRKWMGLLSSAQGNGMEDDASLTPELIEKLRALGYVH